jgi:hypothetical protein
MDDLWYKDAIIYQTHVKAFFDTNAAVLFACITGFILRASSTRHPPESFLRKVREEVDRAEGWFLELDARWR